MFETKKTKEIRRLNRRVEKLENENKTLTIGLGVFGICGVLNIIATVMVNKNVKTNTIDIQTLKSTVTDCVCDCHDDDDFEEDDDDSFDESEEDED